MLFLGKYHIVGDLIEKYELGNVGEGPVTLVSFGESEGCWQL
jgi:hypothetical protein